MYQTSEEVAAFLDFDMKTKKAIHDAVQDAANSYDNSTPERPRIAGRGMKFTGHALADRMGWRIVESSEPGGLS